MPSVLGKRTRSSTDSVSQTSPSRKRQARPEIFNDENEDPLGYDAKSLDIDELAKSTKTRSSPAKHGQSGIRIPLVSSDCRAVTGVSTCEDNLKPIQILTPQTPRHRDALSKKVPITPKHRVTVSGKPFTPQTPRTPFTPGNSTTTIYSAARQLFTRSNEPGRLIGREAEKEELVTFIQIRISEATGGCIYVSGPPGTGKSAMVNEVTEDLEVSSTTNKAYINCMSIKNAKDLYASLVKDLCGELEVLEGEETKALQNLFVSRKKNKNVYIVTLDEIDHILTLDLEILYKLFEWSLQKSSHLVLIGIANALDLTDRFLPRLKARNLKPQLLPFLPYTAAQIKNVITTRLKSLIPESSATPDYVPFLHPGAIELCSRKVASQSGDLRKAFDICRRAIDVIESETKAKHEKALLEQTHEDSPSKQPLEENQNLASPSSPKKSVKSTLAQSLAALTATTAPRALIMHVNKITSSTFGNGASQRLKTLNLQQKAALCALVALEKSKRSAVANVMATPSKTRNEAPTIKALYTVYCMLCTRDSILHPLASTEFRDVVGSLETLSLISAVDGKNGSFVTSGSTPSKRGRKLFGSGVGIGDEKRVGSCVGEREVAQAVEGLGAGILKNILNGEGLE